MSKVRLKWVYGNTLNLAILMKKETMTEAGIIREDYVPPVGSVISVIFESNCTRYEMPYTLDGNVLVVTNQGDMPTGIYGCEVTVSEPNQELRSMWKYQLEILYETREKMAEYNEFQCDCPEQLEASVFYFAKGDAATIEVGNTTTVPAGTPARVLNRGNEHAAILDFEIPQGPQGEQGIQGERGPQGEQGPAGSDAQVTAENIALALGYTPADPNVVQGQLDEKFTLPTEEEFNSIFN